jgi:DNA (cytosine-5)-methyltransferase 1
MDYRVISTFSGSGGSSLGYKMAGLKVLAACEFIDFQAENYRLNFPDTKVYEQDIRKIDPLEILNDFNLKSGDLDILDGSPPCSDFSISGKRQDGWGKVKKYSNKKQRVDDLFFEYMRFIKAIKPKIFVAENVKGLTIGVAKGYFNEIMRSLKDCGYNVKCKLMNAKYYEVPQSRERVIFIGVREDLGMIPIYPTPNRKVISLKDAIGNMVNDSSEFAEIPKGIMLDSYNGVKRGENFDKFRGEGIAFTHSRLSWRKPCCTITQGRVQDYHPDIPRSLTINELKVVMTIPDGFILTGSFYKQWEAIGRMVPPKMMYHIAKTLKEEILDKTGKNDE